MLSMCYMPVDLMSWILLFLCTQSIIVHSCFSYIIFPPLTLSLHTYHVLAADSQGLIKHMNTFTSRLEIHVRKTIKLYIVEAIIVKE